MFGMDINDKNTTEKPHRSICPVSCILDIIGDKWTLLVVRDLLFGKQTFKELQASPEKVPTNTLADRLKKLEASGLVKRELYQEKPKRYVYQLTDKGYDLQPIMKSMMQWSNKYVPDTMKIDDVLKMLKKNT